MFRSCTTMEQGSLCCLEWVKLGAAQMHFQVAQMEELVTKGTILPINCSTTDSELWWINSIITSLMQNSSTLTLMAFSKISLPALHLLVFKFKHLLLPNKIS